MPRIVILGNSGAGKTTLADRLAAEHGAARLDLDTITWASPGQRCPLADSVAALDAFMAAHEHWVIEGCYADVAAHALTRATELVFLDPGVDACLAHNRMRPWEPHKYPSKAAQDANLAMLEAWVRDYYDRTDETSHAAQLRVFEEFAGAKSRR